MITEDFTLAIAEVLNGSQEVKDIAEATLGVPLSPTASYSEFEYGVLPAPWFHVSCTNEQSSGVDRVIFCEIGIAVPRERENGESITTEINGIKTERRFYHLSQITSTVLKVINGTIPSGLSYGENTATGLSIESSLLNFSESDKGDELYSIIQLSIKQKNCKLGGHNG